MNFVWYVGSLVVFYLLFWKVLSLILALPAMAMIPALRWTVEGDQTVLKRVVKMPVFIVARVFGTELQTFSYGIVSALLTASFASGSSHRWFYYLLGGLFSVGMTAPSGEGNTVGRIEALALYAITLALATS